jgi:hypothetical protein
LATAISTRDIGSIALTVIGLWFIADGVRLFSTVAVWILDPELRNAGAAIAWQAVTPSTSLLIGVALLVFRQRFSRVLFGSGSFDSSWFHLSQFESFVVALFGLSLCIKALVGAAFDESHLFATLSWATPDERRAFYAQLQAESWSHRIEHVVQFIIGSVMVLRSQGLVNVWLRARQAGHQQTS